MTGGEEQARGRHQENFQIWKRRRNREEKSEKVEEERGLPGRSQEEQIVLFLL